MVFLYFGLTNKSHNRIEQNISEIARVSNFSYQGLLHFVFDEKEMSHLGFYSTEFSTLVVEIFFFVT